MDAILERRSIRKYTDEEVTKEQITKLLEAAMAAPSAGNQQPWHFIVVTDRLKMFDIARCHPYAVMLTEAPAAIVVCSDATLEKISGYWVQDCSAATENILLMAQSLGLGSVWLGVYPNDERVKGIRNVFKLPENITPFSIVALGHPAEEKEPSNRFNKDRIHFDNW